MRLAHKRKVQTKLQKRIKATVANLSSATKTAKPAAGKKVVENKKVVDNKIVKPAVEKAVAQVVAAKVDVELTPKQQQVLEIVAKNVQGINPKSIGLEAGQEEAKAASWATGALKKLLEENLVVKEQLAGNKVIYKAM